MSALRILVFGGTGQLGRELARRAGGARLQLPPRAAADLTDPAGCAALVTQGGVDRGGVDAVINAAAYTAVDRAEEEEALAGIVNGAAPGAIALACARAGIPLVHVSTDYVFDGAGEAPFAPDHPAAPLGAYGRSKLAGEMAVRDAGGVHAILRTSWVISAHGRNFVTTMLRLGAGRDRLDVVADQVGGPTCAADLADACLRIARHLRAAPDKGGTYHFSGAPDTSWAGLAREIFARAGMAVQVNDIATADWPAAAPRPANSRLDNGSAQAVFGLARPDWRAGLDDILAELGHPQTGAP